MTSAMRTVDLGGVTAFFGSILGTNEHKNLTRLRLATVQHDYFFLQFAFPQSLMKPFCRGKNTGFAYMGRTGHTILTVPANNQKG